MMDEPLDVLKPHKAGRSPPQEKVEPPELGRAKTAVAAASGWLSILASGIAFTDLLWVKAR